MTRDQWGEIGQRLLKTVGQNNYTTWIKPLEPKQVEDGICTLEVPTNFFGNYVSQNFSELILSEINAIMPAVQRLNFALRSTRAFPLIILWSASQTSWPMPPRVAWPKAVRSPSIRYFSMVVSGSAKRT